jgi:hypothetical protein
MELLDDEFKDVEKITEASLARIWRKREEDVWNQYLKAEKKKG